MAPRNTDFVQGRTATIPISADKHSGVQGCNIRPQGDERSGGVLQIFAI